MNYIRNISLKHWNPRTVLALLALTCSVITVACASRQQSETGLDITENYYEVQPRSIAVLPFDNMTVDLDATPLVRPIVAARLNYMGYDVPALENVDAALHQAGVLVSHDVYAYTPQELGSMLGVDAVMYGIITDFTTKYAVVYASVAVQLRLELVDCQTGNIIWKNEQRAAQNTAAESIITLLMYHDDLEKGIAIVAATNAIWAALEKLRPYAEEAVRRTLAGLPPGHKGSRTYPFDRDPDAFTSDSKTILYQSVIITAPP